VFVNIGDVLAGANGVFLAWALDSMYILPAFGCRDVLSDHIICIPSTHSGRNDTGYTAPAGVDKLSPPLASAYAASVLTRLAAQEAFR